MCGIAGFTFEGGSPASARLARHAPALRRMVAALRHRGPDAQRGQLADGCALGHTRLAIVDLEGGVQPMSDPDTGVSVVFNGEIFNHLELRHELQGGYRFRTRSDTEVLLAAFLARGIDCVRDFVGQFAFAIWDPRERALWLGRDHVGIAPLFYAEARGQLLFASEAKAVLAHGAIAAALDGRALKQTFTLWTPAPPRTLFEGVRTLPPGCVARWSGGRLAIERYWDLELDPAQVRERSLDHALEELHALFTDAVRLRLRADVPVAAYLSGGLDSSLICSAAQSQLGGSLQTFSVAFREAHLDERAYQAEVVRALATSHQSVELGPEEVGELLPEVVAHAEQPLLRSAPAPFLRLSQRVRDAGTRVVLTGEGADETFLGYDLFKETQLRRFWARAPSSSLRPALLQRLYPSLQLGQQPASALRAFFGRGLDASDAPGFSHQLRWENGARLARFFSAEFATTLEDEEPQHTLLASVPEQVWRWPPLQRAQYLEVQTLLSGYLLSAQGDRMLLANGVEGRFPFLDHRLMAFAARLPTRFKLQGLREKVLLKRYARGRVPEAVLQRHKFPYRAPIAGALAGPAAATWTRLVLSRQAVAERGIFEPGKVARLVSKVAAAPDAATESDAMALIAVATTQLLLAQFMVAPARDGSRMAEVEVRAS